MMPVYKKPQQIYIFYSINGFSSSIKTFVLMHNTAFGLTP